MDRRAFLGSGIAVVGGGFVLSQAQPALSAGSTYLTNRAPLAPAAFAKLPPGSIKPRGWLRQQLDLQLEGLNGRLPELSDYLVYETNGWVDADKEAWEELPYWLRGFGDLGYVTGDERVLALTRRWIDGILSTQAPDGFFGPSRLRTSLEGGPDFWPHMPLLNVLRSFAEYTGDERIVPFLTNYFRFQHTQPAEVFGRSWGSFRCGDNLDSIYWLYNKTGEEWLLDLVHKVHAGSADYTSATPSMHGPNWHNVNLAQGFREPLQYGVLASDPKFREATYRNYDTIMQRYGQFPGGGFAGDENSRPGYDDPRQGFETCGIVEFMHSFELLTRLTGDTAWADRCEELAFNSLPASLDPSGSLIHYVTCANSIQLDDGLKTRGQFENYFPLLAYLPGIHNQPIAYRCCPHNYGMGWPYFAEELWLSTPDGGLCASMYAASEVVASVADGVSVRVVADTEYPFLETVSLTVTPSREVEFPLYLRIPGWCDSASVSVNGEPVPASSAGTYARVSRVWRAGDEVSLQLPMRPAVRTWPSQGSAVSVDRGPLTYSLAIAERWSTYAGTEPTPGLEVFAESPWNYGLELGTADAGRGVRVRQRRRSTDGVNPFTRAGAPVELSVLGRLVDGWVADPEGVVRPLQQSPAASSAPLTELTLIPMGAARLRITTFPRIGHGPSAVEWTAPDLATTSHSWRSDSVDAVGDGLEPSSSADHTIPRLTWWDHKGTAEWVQYAFAVAREVSSVAVYWFDDTGLGACRVPASWRLLYLADSSWVPVPGASPYGVERDRYNEVTFDPVTTSGLRLEVQQQDDWSGGILEWKVS